jgi:hypothetical protein
MGQSIKGSAVATPSVVEALETRELFSAATVWQSLIPHPTPHHHGVHASPKVGAVLKRIVKETGPDILGAWSGTFQFNASRQIVDGSFTLTSRHNDSFTGMFDTTAIGGANVLSTVTVGKNRAFNAVLKAGKKQVSIAAVVTSDLKHITGRFSVETSKGWATGVFTLSRE